MDFRPVCRAEDRPAPVFVLPASAGGRERHAGPSDSDLRLTRIFELPQEGVLHPSQSGEEVGGAFAKPRGQLARLGRGRAQSKSGPGAGRRRCGVEGEGGGAVTRPGPRKGGV